MLQLTSGSCEKQPCSEYFIDVHSHSVLHDWPDSEVLKILGALKPAMERGYSKLLLDEIVIGSYPTLHTTGSDITMMGLVSGMERKNARFRGYEL